ncbi:MAG: radical SAM protein [Acidobacteria bacterium]|nr:radical SAM protein [Acidobacteriota bacterium]
MRVTEIFHSIQGESTYAGWPCTFVRLTGCNLRCTYCDTAYAFVGGEELSIEEVAARVKRFGGRLLEITGGEPLLQPEIYPFSERMLNEGYRVMIETGGSLDISGLDPRIIRIMDLKTPGSGFEHANRWENLESLKSGDEVKFVICDRTDFDWASSVVRRHELTSRVTVLFSPEFERCRPGDLAGWVLDAGLEVRVQVQLHKYLWEPGVRGV